MQHQDAALLHPHKKVRFHLVSAHIMVFCRLPSMAGTASIADAAAADAEEIEGERPGRGRATTRSPVIAPPLPSNSEESQSAVRSSQVWMHVLALFSPEMSILFQKRHPYSGNLDSENAWGQ